jgi:hypothetical protein
MGGDENRGTRAGSVLLTYFEDLFEPGLGGSGFVALNSLAGLLSLVGGANGDVGVGEEV